MAFEEKLEVKNVQLSDFIRGLFHLFRQALEFMLPDVECVLKRSSPAHASVVLWIEPGALGLLASPPPLCVTLGLRRLPNP